MCTSPSVTRLCPHMSAHRMCLSYVHIILLCASSILFTFKHNDTTKRTKASRFLQHTSYSSHPELVRASVHHGERYKKGVEWTHQTSTLIIIIHTRLPHSPLSHTHINHDYQRTKHQSDC